MLVCNECGRPIATCCDIFETYKDEETGRNYSLCLDCMVKLGKIKTEEEPMEGDCDDEI